MRRFITGFLILSVTCLIYMPCAIGRAEEKKVRVAVVEFEMRTDIGLENAGKIIPEMLATELLKLDKYHVEERILMSKILEEQKLALTGLVQVSTAAKVGEIFGVKAIVTGSAMKVADEITISARVISATTGQVLESGLVKMKSLKQLSRQMEVLANKMCGISPDEFTEKKEREERERTTYGIEWGVYYGIPQGGPQVLTPTYLGLFFQSRLMDIYFYGAPPLGKPEAMFMQFGVVWNINPFIGVGAAWNRVVYNYTSKDADYIPDIPNFSGSGAGIVIKFRPLAKLSARLMMGLMYDGEVDWKDGSGAWHTIPAKVEFTFPPQNIIIEIDYKFMENIGAKWFMVIAGVESAIGQMYNRLTCIGLTLNYSFALARRK